MHQALRHQACPEEAGTPYPTRATWELVILVESYREPRHDGTEFLDGLVRGRAFLYDYAEDAVVCVASVNAHNSESVLVRFQRSRQGLRGNQALLDDLDEAALTSALAGLQGHSPAAPASPATADSDEAL